MIYRADLTSLVTVIGPLSSATVSSEPSEKYAPISGTCLNSSKYSSLRNPSLLAGADGSYRVSTQTPLSRRKSTPSTRRYESDINSLITVDVLKRHSSFCRVSANEVERICSRI